MASEPIALIVVWKQTGGTVNANIPAKGDKGTVVGIRVLLGEAGKLVKFCIYLKD